MNHLRSQSRLDIIIGPMFSGKSSTLLSQLSLFGEMGLPALYINHGIDNRASTDYSSHSPFFQDQQLNITTLKTIDLDTLDKEYLRDFDIIGIDEAQFFDEKLVSFVKYFVEVEHKYLIVCGLDGNFRREKFGYILDLVPFADSVVKKHAYCMICAATKKKLVPAMFTQCLQTSTDDSTVIVGGSEKFQAVCRDCYMGSCTPHDP